MFNFNYIRNILYNPNVELVVHSCSAKNGEEFLSGFYNVFVGAEYELSYLEFFRP